ncbi:MAG: restriction endonuclease [Rubrobacteraceae bacterium]|nr:restriction endonuclease [Rubrobacteraceae bacterium]
MLLNFVARRDVGLTEGLKELCAGLLLIGTVATVAWVAWRLWSRPKTPTAEELASRFEAVRLMSGTQFEVFVADLFKAMGHQVLMSGGVGDQGVDIVMNPRGRRIAVQCKNHVRPVGNKPVQEVYAGARHHRCVEAWVVAPAGYTRGALDLAESTHVSLYDADSVHEWIREIDTLEKERASGTPSEIIDPSPQYTSANTEMTETGKRAVRHPHRDDPPKN